MKILLIDDDSAQLGQWTRAVTELSMSVEVEAVTNIADLTRDLDQRRLKARGSDSDFVPIELDDADIVAIDYDLGEAGQALTGRRLAYLARCYSNCGTIVLMNEAGDNAFDLTLKLDFSSFADLEIGSEQLGNPRLWKGGQGGYRPWAWPILLDEVDDRLRRAGTD